jgi:hypothetical protein
MPKRKRIRARCVECRVDGLTDPPTPGEEMWVVCRSCGCLMAHDPDGLKLLIPAKAGYRLGYHRMNWAE